MAFHPKNLIRVNNRIRVPEVRVIDAEGNQLGVLPTPKAMEVAQRSGLDLVEVAPTAKPPVCRICDFGKFRYEMSKKDKQNKAPASSRVKELKFHINIDEHDFEVKMNHARKFLSKGMRVKISLVFRGREMIHAERGAE
ncbi:MAG: translation initiation factor IF-3, partial [Verrucomicrobiae bacterium]|nr:translation initiation factor IF-3 [Verrucomicrobiae bacterium]